MFYHAQYNRVVGDFKQGHITKEIAFKRLQAIEERAYDVIPDAEPDGDITYAVVCAVEEIERIEKAANKAIQPTAKAAADRSVSEIKMIEIETRSINSTGYCSIWRKYNCTMPCDEIQAAIEICKDRKAFWKARPRKYHKDFRIINKKSEVLFNTGSH